MIKRDYNFDVQMMRILNHLEDLSKHFEIKSNWMISASLLILVFMLSNLEKFSSNPLSRIGSLIIIAGCLISSYMFMMNIVPNLIKTKKQKTGKTKNNLLTFSNISKKMNRELIISEIKNLRQNQKEFDRMISDKLYEISYYRLSNRQTMLRYGGWLLMITMILGSILITIASFY